MDILLYSKEKVLYIDEKCVLSYKNGNLFYQDNSKRAKARIGKYCTRFSLLERALRSEPKCAVRINDKEFLVSFDGKVYNYNSDNNCAFVEHCYSRGMKNPTTLTVCNPDMKEIPDVYYGEYIWNSEKGPVAVYKRDNGNWMKVFEFPSNTITHIHNIIYDKYRDGFIILSGDEDAESGIWLADRYFNNMEPLLVGKQQYRSCVAFPVPEGVIYATDTPLEQNHIYLMSLNEKNSRTDLIDEYLLPGPCIYGVEHNNGYYFSTSVEPDSSLPTWRYRVTYKLGKGVASRYVHLINRDANGQYEDILRMKKDAMPIWLFQFGNILFPTNGTKTLYIVTQSTTKGHGLTYEVRSI